ncbi:hypothetical protein AKJ37_07495 [candidate division MSBL1 archaeon SCGC-AAA259I09]|uniref:DUF3368 domain-containing protein n=1 Tax=candidate division MSBL1 archaeon SCGC-AAA259I09 TaxID=1698267 RepID=A0A133UK16_9EURY|nr:hypothetical protein AKJ37_07495 [candidate division MSBL1 archaeon SCGC-AAA259I09]
MIKKLKGEKYLPPTVYEEVVEVGKEKGFDDALVTEELIERGVLKVKEPPKQLLDRIKLHQDIHPGEAETLSLAKSLNAIAITDDPVARAIADMYDVMREGSYMVILRMLNAGEINKEKAKSSLRKLVDSGWRCDVELYENILRRIEEL